MLGKPFHQLCKELTDDELANFKAWMHSLYVANKLPLKIFDLYLQLIAGKELDEHLENLLFLHAYGRPMSPADRKNFSNHFSFLLTKLKDFLLTEEAKLDSFERDVLWLRLLARRGKAQLFKDSLKEFREKAEKNPVKNEMDFYKRLYFSQLSYFNPWTNKLDPKLDGLEMSLQHLAMFHEAASLKYKGEKISKDGMVPVSAEVANGPVEPFIQLYKLLFQLKEAPDHDVFLKMKEVFMTKATELADYDVSILFTGLTNYVAAEQKKGNDYRKDAFDLYDFCHHKKLVLIPDTTESSFILNGIGTACGVKKPEWAEDFLRKSLKSLASSVREEVGDLGKAMIAWHRGDFAAVLKLIFKHKFKDLSLAIRARPLVIKCLVEQKDDERFFKYCEAAKDYFKRQKKMHGSNPKAVLNFIRFAEKLIERKVDQDKLIEKITAEKTLFFRKWLLDKADTYTAIL